MTRPCDRRLSTLPAGPGCRLRAELLVHVPVTVDGGAAGTRGRPPPRQEQSPARESCPRLGAHFNGKQGRSAPSGARIVFRAIRERSAATAGAKSASCLPSPWLEQWGRDLSPSLAVLSSQERSKQWVQVVLPARSKACRWGAGSQGPRPPLPRAAGGSSSFPPASRAPGPSSQDVVLWLALLPYGFGGWR